MSRIQTYANALHETINNAKLFYLNYVAPHSLMFVVLRLHLLFDISQTDISLFKTVVTCIYRNHENVQVGLKKHEHKFDFILQF